MVPATPLWRSSGEPAADRRYEYAQALAGRGDFAEAADVLSQALDLAPKWAAGWFALGELRIKAGDLSAALAFTEAARLDPSDELGAGLKLANIGACPVPNAAPEPYVRSLFDQYASGFDSHLRGKLNYCAPELLKFAIIRSGQGSFNGALDLGCGTGLCGEAVKPLVQHLTGIDLSPNMIGMARAKGIYDHLVTSSITGFLSAKPPACFDLILAADVLVYFGALTEVFELVHHCLKPQGLFAFTLQKAESADFVLGEELRFSHRETYIRDCIGASGLSLTLLEPAVTRHEKGVPVSGLIGIAARV